MPLAAVLALGLIVPSLPAPQPVLAAPATFTVNTTADSNGACEPSPGDCSLREAINAANDNDNFFDTDRIHFNIPGQGVQTIRPQSALPQIVTLMRIDGYTQPGADENTVAEGTNAVILIELDGSQAGLANGLTVGTGGFLEARGLVINAFSLAGVHAVAESNGITLEGNFIGTNAAGTAAKPNFVAGVIANGFIGSPATIGGVIDQPERRNLISGNNGQGVSLEREAFIANNLIGTDRTGTRPLGNAGHGVFIRGAIGAVESNAIAFNGGDGVRVNPNAGNTITRNANFANAGLGIELGVDGPTPNDPGDADTGPNNLQNFPELTSATTPKAKKKKGKKAKKGGQTTIVGSLNSRPNQEYRIEFFASPNDGNTQGRTFLGERGVATDAAGNASFSFTAKGRLTGQAVTTTAISEETGDTSEFSEPVKVKQVKKKKGRKGKKGKAHAAAASVEGAVPAVENASADSPEVDDEAGAVEEAVDSQDAKDGDERERKTTSAKNKQRKHDARGHKRDGKGKADGRGKNERDHARRHHHGKRGR
jgi:CSLREA domain-containing protein